MAMRFSNRGVGAALDFAEIAEKMWANQDNQGQGQAVMFKRLHVDIV